ncbi:MAG TPA: hypothetical protein VGR68_00250 [Actinomycetota bacterium]|nr:hypothetical protein [Actinomycetota bacterium]
MSQTTTRGALAGLLLAAALLGACADQDGGDGGAAGAATTPTTDPGTAPTTAPLPAGDSPITATGTVVAGVEPGCTVLHTDQGQNYLLVGGDRGKLREGARVQVRGRLLRELLSTCQQGLPLQVASVKAA